MEQGVRREVLKMIRSNRDRTDARSNQAAGTYVNRMNGSAIAGTATIPTATTAADTLCVWMAVMPVLASGLFDVRLSTAVTGITTGDSIAYFVTTDVTLTTTVLTGGVAFGSKSSFYPPGVAHAPQMQTNNGTAAGITYTNGVTTAPGLTMWNSGAQVAVTTALNQMMSFVGTVGKSITAGTGAIVPFVQGTQAIIMLLTLISAGSATWQSLSADVSERPW